MSYWPLWDQDVFTAPLALWEPCLGASSGGSQLKAQTEPSTDSLGPMTRLSLVSLFPHPTLGPEVSTADQMMSTAPAVQPTADFPNRSLARAR